MLFRYNIHSEIIENYILPPKLWFYLTILYIHAGLPCFTLKNAWSMFQKIKKQLFFLSACDYQGSLWWGVGRGGIPPPPPPTFAKFFDKSPPPPPPPERQILLFFYCYLKNIRPPSPQKFCRKSNTCHRPRKCLFLMHPLWK